MKVILATVAEPVRQPVTLEQLRGHVRVDDTADDAMLRGYLIAAREHAERVMGRPIVPRTVRAVIERWPNAWTWPANDYRYNPMIDLMLPVSSVDQVTYTNAFKAVVPWTGWIARTSGTGVTRIRPATGGTWPVLGDDPLITIDATAGFDVIPEAIVTAILQLAAHFYANRESVIVSDGRAIVAEVPQTATALLNPFRTRLIG